MKILFKDVGQGDSIILEWKDEHGIRIGLIDANNETGRNPVLEYLKTATYSSVEFIILSHPHSDHFSGLLEILEYLQARGIKIKYFLHTCASQKEYLTASVRGKLHKKTLSKIFRLANELYDIGQIAVYGNVIAGTTREFHLYQDIHLKILSPSHYFYNEYNKVAFKNFSERNNNPDANLLSTVIKIFTKDWFILLTADAPYKFFWDINRKGPKEFEDRLEIAQVPHHGSDFNFYPTFWKSLIKSDFPFAVISVGENYYNHPSKNTINYLRQLKYNLRATNYIGPLTNKVVSSTSSLDLVSTLESPKMDLKTGSDVVFELVNNRFLEIS